MSVAARSPGGTPMRKKPLAQEPLVDDPAAIITNALRKKFSHRVFQDSPGIQELLLNFLVIFLPFFSL